ncbi:MAG: type II secretion system F family protein [Candidatus Limnocylindria bacterium]
MSALLLAAGLALLLAGLVPRRHIAEVVAVFGRRARREPRLAFPGLVESIAGALGGGLSLELAFAEVAPTLPPSLAAPTHRVAASLRLGVPLRSALTAYEAAVPAQDLAPFAVVLVAFERAGGRVTESLARVAALQRGRIALEDERASLTAQARASALVLVALAPLGFLFFAIAMPDYLAIAAGDGRGFFAAAVALEVIAAVWLARLLRPPRSTDELASLIDAVVVGLEAGLTFSQALSALVARAPQLARLPDARRLLADLALGRGSREALATFGGRGPEEARVAALVDAASRFGAPLADLLVAQADALRLAERRRAEARARRLPVLMLFPLTFCVLPALLIVFLGPPLLSLVS